MASLSSPLRQQCLCPFPSARLRLLSVSLGGCWQAGAGPGISSCWLPATVGGTAANPQACLAPWCQLVCAWAVFEAYSQVPEEITCSSILPRAASGLLLFPWVTSQSRQGGSPGNPQPLQHASPYSGLEHWLSTSLGCWSMWACLQKSLQKGQKNLGN